MTYDVRLVMSMDGTVAQRRTRPIFTGSTYRLSNGCEHCHNPLRPFLIEGRGARNVCRGRDIGGEQWLMIPNPRTPVERCGRFPSWISRLSS